jgi:hypothetical protein
MTQTARFCTNCGSALNPANRFCGGCGQAVEHTPAAAARPAPAQPAPVFPPAPVYQPVQQPAYQPAPAYQPPAPAELAEPIVGTVPNVVRRKGFVGAGTENYNMIVTPVRLILVFVSKETMNEAIKEANREAKAQGKGWFGIVGAQMAWAQRLVAKYNTMPVEAIIAQYPGTFVIPNADIRKIKVGAPSDEDAQVQGVMTIETSSGKHNFELVNVRPQDAKRLLQQTLGPLVK